MKKTHKSLKKKLAGCEQKRQVFRDKLCGRHWSLPANEKTGSHHSLRRTHSHLRPQAADRRGAVPPDVMVTSLLLRESYVTITWTRDTVVIVTFLLSTRWSEVIPRLSCCININICVLFGMVLSCFMYKLSCSAFLEMNLLLKVLNN